MSITSTTNMRPKVGIGVFVTSKNHPGCILLGRRKGTAPGDGLFALPGGHLEFGESWESCARRETMEETGLQLSNVIFCTVVNAVDTSNDYHYVEIFMMGDVDSSIQEEPKNMEPEKCEGWLWCDWNNLPDRNNLFISLNMLRDSGFTPF